jgi:hypothetical protein
MSDSPTPNQADELPGGVRLEPETTPRRTIQYTERDCEELRVTDPMNTTRCHKKGFDCDYVAPYGFAAEAGCPYHD